MKWWWALPAQGQCADVEPPARSEYTTTARPPDKPGFRSLLASRRAPTMAAVCPSTDSSEEF